MWDWRQLACSDFRPRTSTGGVHVEVCEQCNWIKYLWCVPYSKIASFSLQPIHIFTKLVTITPHIEATRLQNLKHITNYKHETESTHAMPYHPSHPSIHLRPGPTIADRDTDQIVSHLISRPITSRSTQTPLTSSPIKNHTIHHKEEEEEEERENKIRNVC